MFEEDADQLRTFSNVILLDSDAFIAIWSYSIYLTCNIM